MMKNILRALLLAVVSVQAEMLVNGDFEAGNIGFGTDYTFVADIGAEAAYTVDSSVPNNWAPGFGDHTSGSGLMLLVNSATDTSKTFWTESVSTAEGVQYAFSGWIAVLTGTGLPTPTLQFKVDGSQVGSWSVPDLDDTWQSFSFNWTGSGSVQTLALYDTNGQAIGCDFAIDDLQAIPEPAGALMIGTVSLIALLIRRWFGWE